MREVRAVVYGSCRCSEAVIEYDADAGDLITVRNHAKQKSFVAKRDKHTANNEKDDGEAGKTEQKCISLQMLHP